MKFLPYVEGKEPYMPPNKSECVTFFWDCGDVPIFGIATYFKKGEKVTGNHPQFRRLGGHVR